MDWSKISSVVGTAAPILGTLLGGPAGAAAGSLVAAALGTSNDPEAVSAALVADPSALAKIRELEINSKVQLQQLVVQAENNRLQAEAAQYAAEASDRDSARRLAATQPKDWIRPSITMVLLFGGIGILIAVFSGWGQSVLASPTSAVTVGTAIGFWFNEVKQSLGFYFGMTKDAAANARTITNFAVADGTVTSKKDEVAKESK